MQTKILYVMVALVAFILIARASVFTVGERQAARLWQRPHSAMLRLSAS